MGVKWDDKMDVRLLLLIISVMTINWNQIANKWAAVYGLSTKALMVGYARLTRFTGGQPNVPQPTQKAITEHVAKLRKKLDGSYASPTKATAGPSTIAFSSSLTKPSKKTLASTGKPKGKAKQKVVDSGSDSDDSEMNRYEDQSFKKEEKEEDMKPGLFGETIQRTRQSLARSARPQPGHFTDDNVDLVPQFVLTDVEDSDCEDDTTVQSTPTATPTPVAKSLQSPLVDFKPTDPKDKRSTEADYHTPKSTPAPRKRVDDEDESDCILVSVKKARKEE